MSAATDSLTRLRDHAHAELAINESSWIAELRREAFASFLEQGFPTRRLESWKGTNFAAVEKFDFQRVATEEMNPVVVTGDGTPELDFVDGRLETANSQAANLPHGVRLISLAEARRQSPEVLEGRLGTLADPKSASLVALQTAFLDDGAVLLVDADTQLDSPIRLRFGVSGTTAAAPTASFPRLLVVAGERSRLSLVLEHDSGGTTRDPSPAPGLTAFVAEYHLAAGAHIETVQIQDEDASRIHFTSSHARLEGDAQFDSHIVSLSPGLVRSELDIVLAEPGAKDQDASLFPRT